jgi:hypothetical protein
MSGGLNDVRKKFIYCPGNTNSVCDGRCVSIAKAPVRSAVAKGCNPSEAVGPSASGNDN